MLNTYDKFTLFQYFGQRPFSRKNMHFSINYIVSVPPFGTETMYAETKKFCPLHAFANLFITNYGIKFKTYFIKNLIILKGFYLKKKFTQRPFRPTAMSQTPKPPNSKVT